MMVKITCHHGNHTKMWGLGSYVCGCDEVVSTVYQLVAREHRHKNVITISVAAVDHLRHQ